MTDLSLIANRSGNQSSQQALEGEHIPADKAGAPPKRRRFRLTDARGVRRELAALYAELRNGETDIEMVKAGGFILRCLLESIRADEIERRITQLENKSP